MFRTPPTAIVGASKSRRNKRALMATQMQVYAPARYALCAKGAAPWSFDCCYDGGAATTAFDAVTYYLPTV